MKPVDYLHRKRKEFENESYRLENKTSQSGYIFQGGEIDEIAWLVQEQNQKETKDMRRENQYLNP